MTLRFFAFVGLVAFALGCADAQAAPRHVVFVPEDIPTLPTEETVNVRAAHGRTTTVCLGVLVAPRVVLTASHCAGGDPITVDRALVANDATVDVTRIMWDPRAGRTGMVDVRTTDVAILVLSKPIALASYPTVATRPVHDGARAMSTAKTKGGLAAMEIHVEAYGDGYYRAPHFARPGDSGGPVYVGAGAHRRVIAVESGGSEERELLARVDPVSSLVDRAIAETRAP